MSAPKVLMTPDEGLYEAVKTHLSACEVSVDEKITEAHAIWLSRLRRPGTWWTGAERIAIAKTARAARDCPLCAAKKEALSPNSVTGEYAVPDDVKAILPHEIIELVCRAVTDVNRMTKSAIAAIEKVGLDHGHYVEALGLTVVTRNLDTFCRGLGLPFYDLSFDPVDGEPSRIKPVDAAMGEEFVPMIRSAVPEPPNDDLWDPKTVGNVYRALSYVPNAHRDTRLLAKVQYVDIDHLLDFKSNSRALARVQSEYVASRVSAINECFY
ncbi:MAG: alkylhydroperoxidase-related (seleno)protein [Pseudomonadota bacterium]